MSEESNKSANIHRVPSIDEPEQRHPRAMFQASPSTISTEIESVRRSILDILDDVYSNRAHRQCMDLSYSTLLSMTLAIIFWIAYWLTWNRCQNSKDVKSNTPLCNTATTFEVFIFVFVIASPVLMVITIFSWVYYACYNPLCLIRERFIQLKLEGNQWQEQLDSYDSEHRLKYLQCLHRKQRTELSARGYGYVILSPYGLVVDELVLISARKSVILKGAICHNKKLIRLTFGKTYTRPWRINLSVYLPEDYIEQNYVEKLQTLLRIRFEQTVEP